MKSMDSRPMLNAYPDSLGENLSGAVELLSFSELQNTFSSFYILPSLFNTDLDRGFSVIDYSINKSLASEDDLQRLKDLGIALKLDFILNHASVLSPQFQDILKNGDASPYKDFFIQWNQFWQGLGEITADGYIQPRKELIENMFFRKPGLPILMVRYPNGQEVPYWNTFYQSVNYRLPSVQELMKIAGVQYTAAEKLHNIISGELARNTPPAKMDFAALSPYKEKVTTWLEDHREYLGQMDLNLDSPMVWDFYGGVLKTLADYGASIVRLDAFAYAPKAPGEKNFLNEPATWEVLKRVSELAKPYNLQLLPEIHAGYGEGIYEKLSKEGYMTYDFFLPGLLLDALEYHDGSKLALWAEEQKNKNIQTVNMLGCHDGIPLLDLKGLLEDSRIEALIERVVARGGYVKNLHGQKNVYYQVNATYYSALGENDGKMILARALQLFMPGKPQVWYLDLFAGKNDHEAVARAGEGGHKEINRTNLDAEEMRRRLEWPVVMKQLELLRLRNIHPAFGFDSQLKTHTQGSVIELAWNKNDHWATLTADLSDCKWKIEYSYEAGAKEINS